jgi:hypothetical protein
MTHKKDELWAIKEGTLLHILYEETFAQDKMVE